MSVAHEPAVLEKIRTRGYRRVTIRPTVFKRHHIAEYSELYEICARTSVRLRGWDYPHVDAAIPTSRGEDWVGQEIDWEDVIEVWRLYQSGQFVQFRAIAGDWRDQSRIWAAEPGWAPGRFFCYVDTIYEITEIFEFAARLALSPAGSASMRVEIQLKGLQGRRLVEADATIPLRGEYVFQMPSWHDTWEGPQPELIARPRELAADAARKLFARFGLDLRRETLAAIQERIGR